MASYQAISLPLKKAVTCTSFRQFFLGLFTTLFLYRSHRVLYKECPETELVCVNRRMPHADVGCDSTHVHVGYASEQSSLVSLV